MTEHMPILKSCPHRVKTLVGTDLIVTKLSNRICTCYAIKRMAVRNVGSPYWLQRSNDVSFFADLYYKSVRIFGRFCWSNPSENWCKGCTKSLGDPFKPLRH